MGGKKRKKGDPSRTSQVHRKVTSAGDDPYGQKLEELLRESRELGEGGQKPESLTIFQRFV